MVVNRVAGYILVDTDILIDAGRGIAEAVDCLRQIEGQHTLATSVVTQMELIIGCRDKRELRTVEVFLQRFHIIDLNEYISLKAVELLLRYRLSHGLLIADALIASTAIHLHQPFVTKNNRDYRFITDLHLLPYPAPFSA